MSDDGANSEMQALNRFGKALSHLRGQTSSTVPSQILQAFVAVAADEGKPLTDYAAALSTSMSTASRHFMMLTNRTMGPVVGFGLIIARGDPQDLRRKGFWLTESGQRLKADMMAILND